MLEVSPGSAAVIVAGLIFVSALIHGGGLPPPAAPGSPSPLVSVADPSRLAKDRNPLRLSLDIVETQARQKTVVADARPRVDAGSGERIVFIGWAAETNWPGRALFARIGRGPWIRADYGNARPDVASAFANPALEAVGFDASLVVEGVPGTSRDVDFALVSADGRTVSFANRRAVVSIRRGR